MMLLTAVNSIEQGRIVAIELAVLGLLYVLVVWGLIPNALESHAALLALLLLVLSATPYYLYFSPVFLHKDTLANRGLGTPASLFIRTDNLMTAWRALLLPALLATGGIVFAGWYQGARFFSLPDWYSFFLKLTMYHISAFMQDIVFFSFILVRLKKLQLLASVKFKQAMVVTLFALLFALMHLPNVPLMGLTFIFAFSAGHIFYVKPNLHAVLVVHAFLGTLLYIVYGLDMKIGSFYGMDTSQGHFFRYLLPFVGDLIGNRW